MHLLSCLCLLPVTNSASVSPQCVKNMNQFVPSFDVSVVAARLAKASTGIKAATSITPGTTHSNTLEVGALVRINCALLIVDTFFDADLHQRRRLRFVVITKNLLCCERGWPVEPRYFHRRLRRAEFSGWQFSKDGATQRWWVASFWGLFYSRRLLRIVGIRKPFKALREAVFQTMRRPPPKYRRVFAADGEEGHAPYIIYNILRAIHRLMYDPFV